jgi:hypothetical protein|tara:strand:+ start:6068 stop:6970 length:903 start_codon:yes stop_codon:yes gene_type:complete
MSTQTVEQVQRLSPFLEGLEKRLLQTAFGEFDGETQKSPGLLDSPLNLPQFQIAGLDPLQQQAFAMAPQLVGSYAPFISGAAGQTLGGQAALGAGLGMLADPAAAVDKFMNPYQSSVIDEINRQAQIGKTQRDAQAVSKGAFGGSRQGIVDAEAEGRRLAAIGDAQRKGFQDALTASQKSAQLMGGLGQAFGGLAGTTADLGRVQSELGRADLGMLSGLGEIGRTFQQQQLDAGRQNILQQQQDPFTRLELGQSLIKGIPSSGLSSTFRSVTTPSTNPFLAGVGAYTALQGISPSGGFAN